MSKPSTRREFMSTAAKGAAAISLAPLSISAKSYKRIIGANDRLGVAMLGCYRRFPGLLAGVALDKLVDVHYVCDVDARRMAAAVDSVKKANGQSAAQEKDMRKIFEDKAVDVVFNATPDHWHAPGSWLAMDAGKHVYVEKPCSHNPRESELLMSLQKYYNKVVQMGNQQRSAPESVEIIKAIHAGAIGEVYTAVAFYSSSRGRVPAVQSSNVPDYLDWDLFQGPAPRAQFKDILGDYMWHWFWDYGTGETGNNATHELDIARWALQVEYPDAVYVNAGKQHYKDDPWTMYDTMDATFEFAGKRSIKWDGKSRSGYSTYGSGRGTIIYGSEGTAHVNRGGYRHFDRAGKLVKERKAGGQEAGNALGGGGDMTSVHVLNFLDAVRGKAKQNSTIQEGAISTQLCHYANISYRMGNARLEIDAKTGHFKNKKVMKKYWGRDYEKGWAPPKV